MKHLITILIAIALLSCEKEETYVEYKLIVTVENILPAGTNGETPSGYFYSYIENNELKEFRQEYVGNNFSMAWNTYQPLYIMLATENQCDVRITVYREGIDDYNTPFKQSRGFRNTVIDIK